MPWSFVKMQGLGNDFIVMPDMDPSLAGGGDWSLLAPRLCDRRFGIGADGLLLVLPSEVADFRMRIFNADGSEPEMCGNGLRCFARYLQRQGLAPQARIRIETGAGVREALLMDDGRVQVDMGIPEHAREEALTVGDRSLEVMAVSMGNPHAVVFVDDLSGCEFDTYGPLLEAHPAFPRRANAEFVQVLGPERLRVKVWERGVGPTLACGTGACAVLVAAVLTGRANRRATIELPGGELEVEWRDERVIMTGAAKVVYSGRLDEAAMEGN